MLQGGEIIIILLLALIVLGPRRLPEFTRKIGQWSTELRRAARDIREGLDAEVADLKEVGDDLRAPFDEIKKSVDDINRDVEEAGVSRLDWTGPKPVSGPTPEEAMADLDEIEGAEQEKEKEKEKEEGGA